MSPHSLALLAICLAAAIPGILLIRHPRLSRQAGGLALLLLATGSGYIGIRAWMEAPPKPAPLVLSSGTGVFQTIAANQLPEALAAARGSAVMLEFHADWCPGCIRWEKEVFSQHDIRQRLMPLTLLRIDATEMTPDVQALLQARGIPGLPAILLFDRQGRELADLRLLGEMSADEFRQWADTRLTPLL